MQIRVLLLLAMTGLAPYQASASGSRVQVAPLEGAEALDRVLGVVTSQNMTRFLDRGLHEVSRSEGSP